MLHETFKERLGDRPLTRKAAALLKEADRLDQELAELRPQISAGRQKRDALIKAYNSPPKYNPRDLVHWWEEDDKAARIAIGEQLAAARSELLPLEEKFTATVAQLRNLHHEIGTSVIEAERHADALRILAEWQADNAAAGPV